VIDDFTHQPRAGDGVPRDLREGEVPVQRIGDSMQLLADEASSCVRAQQPGLPFFLSLQFNAPHWPWMGPEDEAVSCALKDLFHYEGGNLQTYGRRVKWNGGLLPITDDVFTHGLTPDIQADRYLPYREKRQLPGSP
jgi:hypothetical protein